MNILTVIKQSHKINELECQVDMLEERMKDELYSTFLAHMDTTIENRRLIRENRRLRHRVKVLKDIIKDEK